ncbi:conditioned medium-induced protein 4 [Halorussus gelatinilyticus]|uniref:Conditioned medium-induced protein 4 n=1 Tax=Halorussus gelatinilyticus TaxID=2937524 RepID=A0A8U0IKV4_9EURY|nr:conditioned medium-induced protein 4 [Halorussus gelatinilyticus]UPW01743.1 conditioned medium-induced protein 4 [Halorussus gelatinilyticus]
MDEKTEELRDIFMDVTDESTVTERQEETHGSLSSETAIDDRLAEVVGRMRDRYDFTTTLSDDELVSVVRGFYAGDSDAEIARELGDASLGKTVARARIDLHLLRESDEDAPFDLADLRDLLDDDASTGECAAELDVSESTVRRYRRVIDAKQQRRTVNDQFRNEFENVLQDRELSDRMTESLQEDGLDDATEGMETNVSF